MVLGTRVLKRRIFEVPRLGCINLHKGRVPKYRGMPPGFWELYDGAASAGVTVHFIDEGLDTGDVLGTSEIPIHRKETPESLSAKLTLEGSRLLAKVVSQIQAGYRRTPPAAAFASTNHALVPRELNNWSWPHAYRTGGVSVKSGRWASSSSG